MTGIETLSLVVTIVCLLSFSIVFTVLFRHYYLSAVEEIELGLRDAELLENAVQAEKEKKSKLKKVAAIAGKTFSWLLLAIVAAGFCFSLYARIGGDAMVFGESSWVVIASGSMQTKNEANSYLVENHLDDQFATYDIIQIRKYRSESDVKLYDVVAFKDLEGRLVVHRIRRIDTDDSGAKAYVTRGDANPVDDTGNLYKGALHYENLVGYYTDARIPTLGVFVIFLQSGAGIVTVLAILYCVLMFDRYKGRFEGAIEARSAMLVGILEYDLDHPEEKPLHAEYRETLIYGKNAYRFESGTFIGKESLDEGGLTADPEPPIREDAGEHLSQDDPK